MSHKETIDKMLADANAKATKICNCGSCSLAVKIAEEIIEDMVDDELCAAFMEHVGMVIAGYLQQIANVSTGISPLPRIAVISSSTIPLMRTEFVVDIAKKLK